MVYINLEMYHGYIFNIPIIHVNKCHFRKKGGILVGATVNTDHISQKPTLETLLHTITPENRHSETEWYREGKELL